MSNERITENIVREHFKKCPDIILEEQQSANDKIKRLLKNSSKNGNADGRPDFIIQLNNNHNLVIIVECKFDINKHESNTQDNYKDYAVDGVKLYASFLSKEYDVIAIAVSGNKDNLKVSHFLQLRGTQNIEKLFKNEKNILISANDLLGYYEKDDRKYNQYFLKLLNYAEELNQLLYDNAVLEASRSLLIAGILIVLQNKSFVSSYKTRDNIKNLIEDFLSTIRAELEKVKTKHIEDIMNVFSFVKSHTILSKDLNIFKNIIEQIDNNINNFIKTYQYRDVLGQVYIEFLSYAMSDKKSGIVLTPPHITELFCELANVNENSIVLDNCSGTGGFLIAAMSQMLKKANGEQEKIKSIKDKQLIGIEKMNEMYALLCCNMAVHGDGRSNLFKGSCFDNEFKDNILKLHPNVGFLNPPYNIKEDELLFIKNNLSFLEKGSICVAIIPMSCVLAQKGSRLEYKKQLLQEHTLLGVLSMPTELFKNSDVSVPTCIIIFKAKEPHPKEQETWFGYCKDDGFCNRKTQGRADYHNKWNDIKQKWLNAFRNKKEIVGFSVMKEVKAEDEWCVEAYMETDYNQLNKKDFEDVLKKYIAYQLINDKL
ncbi:MAG: SAM-dependent methyltransferase [Rickettsiales bacterium]|jgi:16S rRNA G966 N2-methylase RsmD|nr:SAM-dependent methyltransferase [Rickettsiales bacterium]